MAIWNGLTEEGAVVPIQVDEKGRVVVSGGGGVPSEVNGAAKAAGRFLSDGQKSWAMNLSGNRTATGIWSFTFDTAFENNKYSVLATLAQNAFAAISVVNFLPDGFELVIAGAGGMALDADFSIAVFNGEPTEVTPLILPNSALQDIQRLKDALGVADA